MNRENLIKLATYLEGLPIDYQHFTMETYIGVAEGDDWAMPDMYTMGKYARQNGGLAQFPCHTVACALGHGPAAGILANPSADMIGDHIIWSRYSEKFVDHGEEHWSWIFGEEWAEIDNTHRGAAARIRFLLDYDLPAGWYYHPMPTIEHVEMYEGFIRA